MELIQNFFTEDSLKIKNDLKGAGDIFCDGVSFK